MSLLSLFLSKIYIHPFGKENQSAFIRYIQHVRHLRTRSAVGADYFSLCRCVHILRLHYTLISGFPQVHTAHFSLCRAGRKSKLLIYHIKAEKCIEDFLLYDVDGICATTVLYLTLKDFTQTNYIIPDRFKDGYGISNKLIDKAKNYNTNLIIT